MHLIKFNEFLKEREVNEAFNNKLNRSAMDFDRKLSVFNSRFKDSKEAEEAVRNAGYHSISSFVSDSNDKKWTKLRFSGQKNYV